MRVMVVDDEAALLDSTVALLTELGFEAYSASDARGLVGTLRRVRPDVLMQDVRMPGLDIAALVREIRADAVVADIPILLFSAGMDLEELRAKLGVDGVLEKPFHPAELRAVLERAARAPVPV